MDVKTIFLHGAIKEEVYVEKPMGLKQAPRAWYKRMDSYLMKLGFTRSNADSNLYFKVDREKPLILVLCLDDLFLTGADPLIHQCKRELVAEFERRT